MELSSANAGSSRQPERDLRLYNQFKEKDWDHALHLFGRDPKTRNYIDGIFRVSEMPGMLEILNRSELQEFSITCYPSYQVGDNNVRANMKFVRDAEIGFRLSEIELSNRYKKLQLTIKDRNYFPDKSRLLKRFRNQLQLEKRGQILPRRPLRRHLDKEAGKGLEP